jgi:hypothetical protein
VTSVEEAQMRRFSRQELNEAKSTVVFMRNQKWRHPNAYKHGVFASMAIVPGEDPREFEALHSAVVEEWTPAGATEQDAVLTIAKGMWLKRRLQKFFQAQLFKCVLDPKHPLFDEAFSLARLATVMEHEPESAFQKYASSSLRADKINYLNQKFPRSDFKSAQEWAQAIIDEIYALLAQTDFEADHELALLHSSVAVSDDLFKSQLALDERLDAMIDRAVKRLVQTKAMKQMLGQTSTKHSDERPAKNRRTRTSKG